MKSKFLNIEINSKVLKAVAGAILLKLGTSVTTCWGNINLYFLSQFHHQGSPITAQTNSIILLISVVPMILGLAFSTKLCDRFGYQFVIRVCAFLFFFSPLLNLIVFNLYSFVISSIIIPSSMFAISSIPILNCMWTHFPQSKNKITAILVIAFGIGSIIWNLLFMHLINPQNKQTNIDLSEDIHFFSQEVTRNTRKTAIIGFAITGSLSVVGSLIIQRQKNEKQKSEKKQQYQLQFDGQQFKTIPDPQTKQNLRVTEDKNILQFQQAIKDERFLLIMVIAFLTGLYQIYLMMNFKIIYMPIVNDDHFLSYCSMICSIVAIFGAFLWGCLGDLKGVAFTILLLSVLDFCAKLYCNFATTKPTIVGMVVLIGLISKSMTTLAGPGFVQYYGIKVGTQMLPFKGVAILVGYLIIPFFQVLTSDYLSPFQYLVCISFASIITLICAIRLFILNKKFRMKQNVIHIVDIPLSS